MAVGHLTRLPLRRIGDAALRRSPAQAAYRARAARHLAVLAYHGVDDPVAFERHLAHLRGRHTPVSLDDMVAALRGAAVLPPRAVLVTFDDGHRSVLERGLPLLRRHGVPAVAFVIAGVVDTSTPFWWAEAEALHSAGARVPGEVDASAADLVRRLKTVPDRERRATLDALREAASSPPVTTAQLTSADLRTLRDGGVDIGNHTWSHPCLDRCDDDAVEHEIRHSHDVLSAALGEAPRAFAYPNGNHDPRAEAVLAALGYAAGFLFDHRLAAAGAARAAPLRISRLRVGSTTSPDRFATIVSGLHPAVHRLRGGV
jgi:peptidoglycan/xylan/chitin deacetylase (PgdA/CDA1 family)